MQVRVHYHHGPQFCHLGNYLQDTSHFLKAEAVVKRSGVRVGVCFPLTVTFLPQRWVFGLMHVCLLPTFRLTATILFQGWEKVLPSFIQIADRILDP